MTLEELKKAVEDASADAWKFGALAPEILALVEAIMKHEEMGGCGSMYEAESGDIYYAIKAFNAKLAAL